MALPRIQAPSPQIFTSDPVEQIYARGTLDRDMSGLSHMFLTAARMNRDQDQQAYLQGVERANQLGLQSDLAENAMNMAKARLSAAEKLGAAGVTGLDQLPDLASVVMNPTGDYSRAKIAEMVAKAAHDRAAAANSGGVKGSVLVMPDGTIIPTIKGDPNSPTYKKAVEDAQAAAKKAPPSVNNWTQEQILKIAPQ